jgi:ribosomal protein S18 acetylase RimI-like enzyme
MYSNIALNTTMVSYKRTDHIAAIQRKHQDGRAKMVQKVLEQDTSGLGAFLSSHLEGPMRVELVLSPSELDDHDLEACLELVEITSGHDYQASSIGWNPRKKREEMMDEDMMYLLVRQGEGEDRDSSELPEPSEEPSSIGSSRDDDEDIEMVETRDAPTERQAASQPNALAQPIDAYVSGSDNEEAAEPSDATSPEIPANVPPLLSSLSEVPATADNLPTSPRSEEHHRQVPEAHRKPTPQASASADRKPDVSTTTSLSSSQLAAIDRYNNSILGFISFMFTYDDPPHEDREVVYIYEIHLHARLRGQGLGSHLMDFVEYAARECQIDQTMLTVFTANEGARRMYERRGYTRDRCSPKDRVMRSKVIKADYIIMSAQLV